MQERQINKPVKLNLDVSNKYLPLDSAFFMLNNERNLVSKKMIGKNTPMPSNYQACEMYPMPGNQYSVGAYRDLITNESYSWTINDNGQNYILRLDENGCQVVYTGDDGCLPLSADPQHAIRPWRAYLKNEKLCAHRHGKSLVWVDGLADIGMVDVEASIATNFFTTPFFDLCPDPCSYTKMCVPLICKQLVGEFIPLDVSQRDLTNHLLDVAVQVCYRHIYYDGRISEWMGVSSTYYQDSKTCFDTSEGFPRCLSFRMPIGNPLVDRIEVAVRRDNELFTDGLSPLWRSVEVVEKYKPYATQSQMWYERDLADLLNFSEDDCCFDYIFCNDKDCNTISTDETNRVYNPMPQQPQGLVRIKHTETQGDSLGFYNYKKGNCPISGMEAKKPTISLQCDTSICNPELVDVTVFALVVNRITNRNGLVYRNGGDNALAPDDTSDVARFNALVPPDAFSSFPVGDGMGQLFHKGSGAPYDVRNFIAYVEGTEYWAQMEQYQSDANFVNTKKVGIISGIGNEDVSNQIWGFIENGGFYYQQFNIKVPKGTRGFIRIASHKSDNGSPFDGQDTSTFVVGTMPDIRTYNGTQNINGSISSYKEEIYFDTCAGAVTLYETLLIDDNYKLFESGSHTSSAYSGYLTDANNKVVAGAEIWWKGTKRAITDFNGFYHFWLFGNENTQTITPTVRVETGCTGGFNDIKTVTINGAYGQMAEANIQITDIDSPTYKSNFYEQVNVYVRDCANKPVGGIRVALSGSKFVVADAISGAATFKVRNYSTRNRVVKGILINHNDCFALDCTNNCNPCNPITADTNLSACFSGTPYLDVMTLTKLNRNTSDDNRRGLKAGGRYPFGFVVKWPCNKISAVYPLTILNGSLPQNDNYLNIPKTQDKGLLSFCNIEFRANGIVLPDGASCISIVRGSNVNDYVLQWVVDKIERTKDNKIKLTIQSLNDFNASYNFETNTNYQYQKNDRVEFISNGDGTIFNTSTYGLLNYQVLSPFQEYVNSTDPTSNVKYFNQLLIDDDGRLDSLAIGAKIELQRPRDCEVEPTYKEVFSIPLIEISGQNVPSLPIADFNTFDTFFVNRKIAQSPTEIFEHHSPSDHWGNNIDDGGKVHFVNRYENEQRFGRNITLNSPTEFNIFGYIEKTFDSAEHGDITAIGIYDGKVGVVISEHDNSLFQVSDSLVRTSSDGIIHAAQPDSVISDTDPKVSGAYGCQYPHIGSILFGDGFITYWDVNKSAYIKHDFNIARDISKGRAKLYFDKRGQFIETFNRTAPNDVSKFRIVTGWNCLTNAIMITVKSLVQGGTYNLREPFAQTNDTILFEPETEDFLTFAGFVPEEYSNLDLYDGNGCAFVAYLGGIPFVHPKIALSDNDYNRFFGVATDWVIGVSINLPAEKTKIPIGYEVLSEDKWYVDKVVTDRVGFESEVPPIKVKKWERHWAASFLFDKHSRGGLHGNDRRFAATPARGNWIAVTLIRDNSNANIYNSQDVAKMTKFGELDMFLFKSEISELQGMSENL